MNDHYLILENPWLRVTILSYGATISSIVDKVLSKELVLGFDDVNKYRSSDKYFGSTIGRVANRISKGHFRLNGHDFALSVNSGLNHLHGGTFGFDKKEFICTKLDSRIECTYFSKHLEEGYPGNLEVKVTYSLEQNRLRLSTSCQSDLDTLINLTNHTYFNLNKSKESVAHQLLEIVSQRVYPIDENGCTFNQPFDVKDTPFDFTVKKGIRDCLMSDHPQVIAARGLDHHFDIAGSGLRLAATLSNHESVLNVYTDKPGVHVYTGNYLDGSDIGYDNFPYTAHAGICFETQYTPDSINFDSSIAPIVKAHQIQEHQTIFEFKHVDEVKYEY